MVFLFETPIDISQRIAGNFRAVRKAKKFTIKELSERSQVSYSSIKRFEHSGEISLVSLIKIASILQIESELKNLFSDIPPSSIQEIINAEN